MTPTLVLDTSVLVAGLRSSLGASYALLGLVGSGSFAEKLAACAELEYLEGRAAKGSRAAYERVLGKVPAATPVPGDERERADG
jgi:hypothetical protein